MSRGMWTHDRFLDVTMLVLKVPYRGPRYLKARVEWFIRGRSLGIKQTVKILIDQLKYWSPR